MKKALQVKLEEETYNLLTKQAKALGLSNSSYIRYLIHRMDKKENDERRNE